MQTRATANLIHLAILAFLLVSCSGNRRTEYQQVIAESTWTYDVTNPERIRKHVSPAPKEISAKYFPAWKKLFMKINNVSEDYFDEHVRVIESGISTDKSRGLSRERGREYFEVLYQIKIDWMKLSAGDHLVNRKKGDERYLSVDEFVAEEEGARDPFQRVAKFIPVEKAPMSFVEAVRRLKQISPEAQYLKPEYLQLHFKSPSYDTANIANGGVLLYGYGIIDSEKNQAVEGYLNLVTGKGSVDRVNAHEH